MMEAWHFGLGCIAESNTGWVYRLAFDDPSIPDCVVTAQLTPDGSSAMQLILPIESESWGNPPIEWLCGNLALFVEKETGMQPSEILLFRMGMVSTVEEPQELRLRISRSSLGYSYYCRVRGLSVADFEAGAFDDANYRNVATLICIDDSNPPVIGFLLEDPSLASEREAEHLLSWLVSTLKLPTDTVTLFKVGVTYLGRLNPNS